MGRHRCHRHWLRRPRLGSGSSRGVSLHRSRRSHRPPCRRRICTRPRVHPWQTTMHQRHRTWHCCHPLTEEVVNPIDSRLLHRHHRLRLVVHPAAKACCLPFLNYHRCCCHCRCRSSFSSFVCACRCLFWHFSLSIRRLDLTWNSDVLVGVHVVLAGGQMPMQIPMCR